MAPNFSDRNPTVNYRIASCDWDHVEQSLGDQGWAALGPILGGDACADLKAQYAADTGFRSRIDMARYNFGRGAYKYFAYPLPDLVVQLRTGFYPHLAVIANRWQELWGHSDRYPKRHADYLARCHGDDQTRPTPLLLRYEQGDYNCLHQDLYGTHHFPLQIAIQLSSPGVDFTGGEFVLTEQRPRMQSRAEVMSLAQGHAVLFPVNERPVQGRRGFYRARMRHGVSRLHSGERHTLGIIFHDAA